MLSKTDVLIWPFTPSRFWKLLKTYLTLVNSEVLVGPVDKDVPSDCLYVFSVFGPQVVDGGWLHVHVFQGNRLHNIQWNSVGQLLYHPCCQVTSRHFEYRSIFCRISVKRQSRTSRFVRVAGWNERTDLCCHTSVVIRVSFWPLLLFWFWIDCERPKVNKRFFVVFFYLFDEKVHIYWTETESDFQKQSTITSTLSQRRDRAPQPSITWGGGWPARGGPPRQRRRRDSIMPIQLTVALGLKIDQTWSSHSSHMHV